MLQRFFVRWIFSPLNRLVYTLSKGRLMSNIGGLPLLMLMTTGRKSGKMRTAPLLYVEDGDAFVVLASFGGQPEHPAWYLNLEADPSAIVRIGETEHTVRAETVVGEEHERLWKAVTDVSDVYDGYQAKTTREIPVVALRRV